MYTELVAGTTLYLWSDEKKLFDALSDELKDGWKVEGETLKEDEREEELAMRRSMFRCGDAACQQLVKAATSAKSAEDFERIVSDFDFSSLSQEQSAEIFFTLGTGVLSSLIEGALQLTESDEDLEGTAGLTEIRHMLLEANASVST